RIKLPQLLYYGSEINLDITWETQVPTGYGQGYGIFSYNDHILSLGNWYPILAIFDHRWDVPEVPQQGDTAASDVSFYSVTLILPQDWILAGTGFVENQEADAQNGKRTWVLSSGPVRDVSYAASPNYQVLQKQVGGTTVRYFAAPVAGARLPVEQALQVAIQAFSLYTELFGPYPYTHFDVAEIDCSLGGYEYPQIIFLDRANRANAAISNFEFLATHEIAHQWFYGLVGNDQVREPWLDEALANYAVVLYRGAYHGESGRVDTMTLWESQYPAALAQIPRGLDRPVAAFNGWPEYRGTIYYAGAEFYDRIRRRLGDERFFAALRLYQLRERYRRATTDDLLHAFSAVSDEDLSDFYGQWFYNLPEPQYPQISAASGARLRPY
ncbi:MAG: M1 family metallopeptidase, partial [Chloroflexi bacterium]|nr:M1 family metallopeptidase [Chloroflexota bacterium]